MTSRRRKIAGGIAALALAAGLVVTGTVAASAAPSAIAFTTSDQDITAANATIEGTVAWTTSGGAITLYIAEADGDIHPNEPCDTLLVAETTWSCVVPLEYGQNSIRAYATADDDLGFPLSTSNAIQVTVGSTEPVTISTPAPANSSENLDHPFTGTGPRMGSVQVQARNEANLADPFVQVCATTVDRFGAWTCSPTAFPDYDRYTVRAVGQTNTAIGVIGSAEQNFAVVPAKPTATVTSTPGLLESTSTANLGDQIVGARWTFWPASGTPQTGLIECPTGWVLAPPPAGGSTVDCDVAANIPGTYLLHGQGFKNDASSSDFAYLGRIPASPVIDSVTPQSEGGVDVAGTVDPTWTDPYGGSHTPGSLGVTVVVDGYGPICTAAADLAGNWECLDTPAPGGLQDFTAYATAVGFGPVTPPGSLDGYFAGSSPYGNTLSATLIDNEVQILSPADGSSVAYATDPMVFSGTSTLPADVNVYVEGPYPFTDSCTATPDGGGAWSCNISSLPTPPVGSYTVTADQPGSLDHVIAFTRILPTPEINGGLSFPVGSGVTAFGGQNLYAPAGTFFGIFDGPTCTSPEGGTSGTWNCSIDLSTLDEGTYPLFARNFDSGDSTLDSAEAAAVLTITAGQPTITCGFSPNGGFSVSSPHTMEAFFLDRVHLEIGSSTPGSSFGVPGLCSGSPGSPFPDDDGSLYLEEIEECLPSCAQSGLEPGLYSVYYRVPDGGGPPGVSIATHSYAFTIPEAPAITTASSTTLSVILSGTATPNDAVRIVRPNGTQLCATTATGVGTWACQFPKSSTSSARAIAVDPSSGGMSAYTAARSIPIAAEPETETETVIDEAPALVSWFLEFGGDLTNLKPGDKFTLNVSGMPVGTEIEIWMHSEPRLIGTATGTGLPLELNLQVPEDIESGAHEIKMIAVTPLGTNYFYTSDATVIGGTDPDKPLDTVEDPKGIEEAGDTGGNGGGGSGQRDDPAAPSGITGKVAPLQAVFDNPGAIAVAGGLALALLFLVALPTELLNSSLSSNTSRLGRVYGTIDTSMTRAQDWLIKKTRSRALVAIILVAIVAVIYGFVDPGFGFDIVSLRLVLSLAIAFFLLSFVASWVSGLIIRRAWGAMAIVALQPSIILFAIIGVIVARILDFSPGFLVGVAIGLELLQASRHVTARAVFVQIAVVTGFSLAAWIAYSLFTPGDDFFGMLFEDTMVATTSEGLTGALIAVFPLKFLDGRELWEVSKRLWAAAFLIVATAFALLVLPTAISGTDVGDYATWLIVFAVFGGVSFAVWLIFVRADKKAAEAEKKKVDA